MARANEGPWYRASKGAWYLTVKGKAVSLGVKGERNEREAIRAWHRLMTNPKPQKIKEAPPKPKEASTVSEVVEAFLTDAKGRLKANSCANYQDLLTAFSEAHGKVKAEGFSRSSR